ncbi:methionine synthase [Falsiroseomonas bella]|uniref:Methionine synthase n=1 Tax=Falsiroseomonas bella TaxID=2184016 RepID=A0A317FGD2_9PROT|nr:methionine synthase [Falsiroseomonas bella]PWS38121.1 methionine synthase [Falsiroseomonas bella]
MDIASLRRSRVDQVGSFLRPEWLKSAFLAHARGKLPLSELEAAQDRAIAELVAKQRALGLPFVTDGEYRRLNWQVSFSAVEGWDLWPGTWEAFLKAPSNMAEGEQPNARGLDTVVSARTPATARLRLADSFPLKELRYLRDIAPDLPAKVTLMGPDRVCQMCDVAGSAPHYADGDDFLADVVAIQRRMAEELVAAGCSYLQLDEPSYTGYVDPATLARMTERGEDPLRNLRRAVEADNAVIAGLAGRVVTGLHICRGNRASMWHREGTYDAIAEAVLGGLRFDRLLLEYDTARAGGFEPLRFLPKDGPMVVLGLVTTKSGEVETVESLLRRLEEAGRFVDLDRVALSPQCGFASGIGGNLLPESAQWRKIEVIQETARRMWG